MINTDITRESLTQFLDWMGFEREFLAAAQTLEELKAGVMTHPRKAELLAQWPMWVAGDARWLELGLELGCPRQEALTALALAPGGGWAYFKACKSEFFRYKESIVNGLLRDGVVLAIHALLEQELLTPAELRTALGAAPSFNRVLPLFELGLMELEDVQKAAEHAESINPALRLAISVVPDNLTVRAWACQVIASRKNAKAAVALACHYPALAQWAWSVCKSSPYCDDALAMYRVAHGDTLFSEDIAHAFAKVATLEALTEMVVAKRDDLTACILTREYDIPHYLIKELESVHFFASAKEVLTDRHMEYINTKITAATQKSAQFF